MDIAIDRLNIQLSADISGGRARAIGDLIGAALQATLRDHAAECAAAPAGYYVPSIAMPSIRVRAGATDDEIAQAVADAVARAMLRELELS